VAKVFGAATKGSAASSLIGGGGRGGDCETWYRLPDLRFRRHFCGKPYERERNPHTFGRKELVAKRLVQLSSEMTTGGRKGRGNPKACVGDPGIGFKQTDR